jgi:hypothetical protein
MIDENRGENMLKKIIAIIVFCLISTLAFAQTAPKQVLSAGDVNNFIANYDSIMDAFDTLGDKYDYIFKEVEHIPGFEKLIRMRTIAAPAAIQDILRKNGLGDNGFEKSMVIMQGIALILMEEDLDSLEAEAKNDPEVMEHVKQAKREIKPFKDSFNTRDIALINNKKNELFELLK